MKQDYDVCEECGIGRNDSGIYRSFINYKGFNFCSWSCILVFVNMYNNRIKNKIETEGNFPSYKRR